MANALDTNALNLEINDMFRLAKSRLIIISPYLSICSNLRKLIEDSDRRDVNIVIIYRKIDENSDIINWVKSLKHVYLGYLDNLHAKYYGEDYHAIISSLNLYEYSQVNNEELGILVDDKHDTGAFYDSLFFIQKIAEHSTPIYATIKFEFFETKKLLNKILDIRFTQLSEPINNICQKKEEIAEPETALEEDIKGFCIRCGKKIGLDSDIYYCEQCYSKWIQWKNPNYQEKFCHICGKPSQTTAYRPVCKECFIESSEVINAKKDVVLKNVKN